MIVNEDLSVVSAIDLVGSKEEPTKLAEGVYIFADNVLAELNIPPATGALQFISQLGSALRLAAAHLAPRRLMLMSSLQFPADQLTDLRAFIFGCTAEYCAWDVDGAGLPSRVAGPVIRPGNGFRSCGGHIHIGCQEALDHPVQLVKALDFFVGIGGMMIDHDSTSRDRRKIYGGAGYFRPTSYGLEYRTPSNFWMASPTYAAVIYRLVSMAVQHYADLGEPDPVYRQIIDGHHKIAAQAIWNEELAKFILNAGAFNLYETILSLSVAPAPSMYQSWNVTNARLHATA